MPDQISVSEFVAETHEDYKAPTASSFTTRTAQCRNTVAAIEEVRRPALRLRPQVSRSPAPPAAPASASPENFLCSEAGRGPADPARDRGPLFPPSAANLGPSVEVGGEREIPQPAVARGLWSPARTLPTCS
ncbi:hypothetical protein P7K49_029862 [Saguinus oedipus]|uniref:Uncharacterized protein n=1 Tax=Saguinus oedipus TaxID=9490 RepID=A0ABQ9U8G4_SAGOE|nr:hypothetical protein P7K49_029862 [Saguinus oedipus]